jgi:hypothetical protein
MHFKSQLSTLLRCSALIPLAVFACFAQKPRESVVLNSSTDQTTVVSFFWFGDMESHWREPMNFYVAGANDPKLHTVSFGRFDSKGVDTWITAAEMSTLIEKLSKSDLSWMHSKKVQPLKAWNRRTDGHNTFDITVMSARGTATAGIRITRMCEELLQFDPVMPTPRLKWQFQTLRWDDGCVIAGYNNEEKPKD